MFDEKSHSENHNAVENEALASCKELESQGASGQFSKMARSIKGYPVLLFLFSAVYLIANLVSIFQSFDNFISWPKFIFSAVMIIVCVGLLLGMNLALIMAKLFVAMQLVFFCILIFMIPLADNMSMTIMGGKNIDMTDSPILFAGIVILMVTLVIAIQGYALWNKKTFAYAHRRHALRNNNVA
jgi:hypothetical protein